MARETKTEISTHITRLIFFALVIGFFFFLIYGIAALTVPMAVALLLAFALLPLVDFLEGLGLPRILAVCLAVGLLIGVTYLLINLLVPILYAQFQDVMSQKLVYLDKAESLVAKMQDFITGMLPSFIQKDTIDLRKLASGYIEPLRSSEMKLADSSKILELVPEIATFTIITPIVTFIFLLQGHEIYNNLLAAVPNRYFEMVLHLVHRIKSQIGAYFRGLAIQWSILAAFMSLAFLIIGLPYGPVIGVFAATANIIPYLGPVIGLTVALVSALTEPSGSLIALVCVIFAVARIADDAIIQPVILAGSVHLHPLIAVLAVITFEKLLGVVGMVIAIPAVGIIMVTIGVMYRSLKAFRVI